MLYLAKHRQLSQIGDTILSDDALLIFASRRCSLMRSRPIPSRQQDMQARLLNVDRGGAIFFL